jgi:hypothetical protein
LVFEFEGQASARLSAPAPNGDAEFVGCDVLGSRLSLDRPFHGRLDQQGNAGSLAFGLGHGGPLHGQAHAHKSSESTRLILHAKDLLLCATLLSAGEIAQ